METQTSMQDSITRVQQIKLLLWQLRGPDCPDGAALSDFCTWVRAEDVPPEAMEGLARTLALEVRYKEGMGEEYALCRSGREKAAAYAKALVDLTAKVMDGGDFASWADHRKLWEETLGEALKSGSWRDIQVAEDPPKPKKPRTTFVKPTLAEVKEYCEERKNQVDPVLWLDTYEANGWTVGRGKPMRDWQACVRNWERRGFENSGQGRGVIVTGAAPPAGRDLLGSWDYEPLNGQKGGQGIG